MATHISRRAALSGAVASVTTIGVAACVAQPAVAAAPGSAAFRSALDATEDAVRRFNSLPPRLEFDDEALHAREERAMLEASNRADRAVPTTWREYIRLMGHMTDGDADIDIENAKRLLSHARRLVAAGVVA